MNMPLPLSTVLNVETFISPAGVPGPSFNRALIVGSSSRIPSVGGSGPRIREYYNLEGMESDGFMDTDPEYLAAEIYFGQSPTPAYLSIGRQDLTAIKTFNISGGTPVATTGSATKGSTALTVADPTGIIVGQLVSGTGIAPLTFVIAVDSSVVTLSLGTTAILSSGAVTFTALIGGHGYMAGDIVTVVQSGASFGQLQVTGTQTSGSTTGVVTALELVEGSQGTGYAALNTNSVTGGTGTGLEVDISAIGETPLEAVQACRAADAGWYSCMFVGTAADTDHVDIATYIEAAYPASTYFYTTGEAAVLNAPSTSLPAQLQALKFNRTFGVYATTQGGLYPNNIYACAAAMGIAMGRNTGAAGSYFDVMFKPVSSIAAEPLTSSQIAAICGSSDRSNPGLNCNVYCPFQGGYAWFMYATMASGIFFDIILNVDMLASDIQYSGVNLLTSVPALAITEGGMATMRGVISNACQRAQVKGFIDPSGFWNGVTVGVGNAAINNGDPLPKGYALYAPPVSSLSSAQRAARVLPSIVVLVIESESGHSLTVDVNLQA